VGAATYLKTAWKSNDLLGTLPNQHGLERAKSILDDHKFRLDGRGMIGGLLIMSRALFSSNAINLLIPFLLYPAHEQPV